MRSSALTVHRRVLVTDAGQRASVAAIRALHSAGWRVSAVDHRPRGQGRWSRFVEQRHRVPDPARDSAAFAASLLDVLHENPQDVMLIGTDVTLLVASDHKSALEAHVRIGLPRAEVVELSFAKDALAQAAREVGLSAPRSVVCSPTEQALEEARTLGFPIVVKPTATLHRVDGAIVRPRGTVVADERALMELLERWPASPAAVMLQEHQQGPVYSFAGTMTADGLIGVAFARYVRTWPAAAGNASFAVTVTPPNELCDRVTRMVERLGWQGIFEVEMIRRPDDTFAVIDFNPRLYGSLMLACRAGAPLPVLWCESLLGNPVRRSIADAGVGYRWEEGELRNLVTAARRGKASEVFAILRPRRSCVCAEFTVRDPGPLLARVLPDVLRLGKRVAHSAREHALQCSRISSRRRTGSAARRRRNIGETFRRKRDRESA